MAAWTPGPRHLLAVLVALTVVSCTVMLQHVFGGGIVFGGSVATTSSRSRCPHYPGDASGPARRSTPDEGGREGDAQARPQAPRSPPPDGGQHIGTGTAPAPTLAVATTLTSIATANTRTARAMATGRWPGTSRRRPPRRPRQDPADDGGDAPPHHDDTELDAVRADRSNRSGADQRRPRRRRRAPGRAPHQTCRRRRA